MTTTYNLAPQPRLRFFYPAGSGYGSLAGQPLAAGKIYTFSSQNHATPKAAYTSNVGSPPPAHTNPIILDINGEASVYWSLNDLDLTDLYYIEVYDSESGPGTGTPILTADNYSGAAFGEDVNVPSAVDFNYVKNAQFSFPWFKDVYNLQYDGGASYTPVNIASWVGAEWGFAKNNTTTVETIEYDNFILGQDVVPENPISYLSWKVQTGGSGETFKVINQWLQAPATSTNNKGLGIESGLSNMFSGEDISFQVWARSSSSASLVANIRQHFGTGGSPTPDDDIVTNILNVSLTGTWTKYTGTISVPSVSGKSVGTNNDSLTQLEFALPLNAATGANIDICNVQLEIGDTVHAFQYKSLDVQQSEFSDWFSDHSGTMMYALAGTREGWLVMNDGTIGNANSGATTYKAENAFSLYAALWNNCNDTHCPVSGGRGASALEDFDADKTITLPLTASRLIGNSNNGNAGAGLNGRSNGVSGGLEEINLNVSQIPTHTHELTPSTGAIVVAETGAGGDIDTPAGGVFSYTGYTVTGNSIGTSGAAIDIMNPFSFLPLWIKI